MAELVVGAIATVIFGSFAVIVASVAVAAVRTMVQGK